MSLGLLLAGIGMDTVSGNLRMTFGSPELLRGINFLVAVIGLFGISEILLTMEERLALRGHAASTRCASCSASGRICRNTG
ncbi:TctA family transporter [Bradyrhizobium yuanmingense]